MKRIAIFASGTGSNARRIIGHFRENPLVRVDLVLSNNPKAGVLEMAKEEGIDTQVIDSQYFYHSEKILSVFEERGIDFLVLAGFLWLMPPYLVRRFDRRIVNIHPALLPKYGGKGMYGKHVHEAVKAASERESGITIHFVDENYDEGDIILQEKCSISPEDTPQDIARKVQQLEHEFFPMVIEQLLSGTTS